MQQGFRCWGQKKDNRFMPWAADKRLLVGSPFLSFQKRQARVGFYGNINAVEYIRVANRVQGRRSFEHGNYKRNCDGL